MFGSEQTLINLSIYSILPAIVILFYVYKRDLFPEPPRIVFITILLGVGISFPIALLIPFFEGYLETLNVGVETSNFYMAFVRAAFLEETLKFLILIYYCLHLDEFNEPMDALVYGVAASIGFAVFENWEYVMIGTKEGIETAKNIALLRAFTAMPMHALAGVFMGFFLIKSIFEKENRKLNLFLSLFYPICLHGLYDLILFSDSFSDYYIYILVLVFLVRAYFVFQNERNLQKTRVSKPLKVMPMNSQIVMTIFLSLFILMSANYFIDTILY